MHPRNPLPGWAQIYEGHDWLLGPTWAFAQETAVHVLKCPDRFQALAALPMLAERSVQQAGKRLGLSQSATSHALDRLRKFLGDQLLVRTASGMEPTPRALSLADPLRAALQDIEGALTPNTFDPVAAEGAFTIGVETYGTIVVLPQLVEIRKEAPGIEITVRSGSADGGRSPVT